MVDCVLATEILFASVDHGITYQFEMGEWSAQDVASWSEVVDALGLTELVRIYRGVSAINGVICHPDYVHDFASGDEAIGERLWHQATALHHDFAALNGTEVLRGVVIAHLHRNAPHLLERLAKSISGLARIFPKAGPTYQP